MYNVNEWDTGLPEEIFVFRCYESIADPIERVFTETLSLCQAPVNTTKGWDVKFFWRDKSSNWIPLAEIKESNNIEVDEDADRAPAFIYWVRKFLN